VAPAVVQPWAATGWLAIAAGHPVVGALAGLVPAVAVRRRLPSAPERDREALRLAALGFARAGEQLASCVTRAWWPAALAVAIASRRARRALLIAAVLPATIDWLRTVGGTRSSRTNPFVYAVLRTVDDVSYGAGVWTGALSERRLGPLLPRRRPPRPPRPPTKVRR
jgi:hypothetical protein